MLKNYNGYTGKERLLSWYIQKYLRDRGKLSWDNLPCNMCGNAGFITPHIINIRNFFKKGKISLGKPDFTGTRLSFSRKYLFAGQAV